MKKIGIITFHRARNYGAVLQAYALHEVLQEKYDVKIVDYRCDIIEKVYYHKSLKSKIVDFIRSIFFIKYMSCIRRRNRRFKDFSNIFFRLSKKYTSDNIFEANSEFDFFISGSDQIWNPRLSNYDWNYFLDFADDFKKYSYAASLEIHEDDSAQIVYRIKKYQSVLVREISGVEMLIDEGIEAKQVCDPVILFDKEEWTKRFGLKNDRSDKYILVYFAAIPQNAFDFARKIACENSYKIIYLNPLDIRVKTREYENVVEAGPIQFLEYIFNAEMVVTTSFHALVFSTIFNVPVYFEVQENSGNNNSRLIDYASAVGMKGNMIKSISQNYDNSIFNWDEINKKLSMMRKDSKEKLMSSLL